MSYKDTVIKSDDPQAIEKLKMKLEQCQNAQEEMKKQNAYFKLSTNFGPVQDINYKYDINSKEINNDRLTIDITYLSYYNKTINDEETYTTDLLEIDSFSKEKVEEIFNNNKDKLPHLTFTYINESDTYYLIDVK